MNNNRFEFFLEMNKQIFKNFRNNSFVSEFEGLLDNDKTTGKKTIQTRKDENIEIGDMIVNSANSKYYVTDKELEQTPAYECIKVYIISEHDYKSSSETSNSTTYNIGSVSGSIIGSQQNATVNNGISDESLKLLIKRHSTPDQEELNQLIDLIKKHIEEEKPMKKGVFSKFAAVLQRNEWITAPLAAFLLELLLKAV